MTLPFSQVVTAARLAGNQAGTLTAKTLGEALAAAQPVDEANAALLLARLYAGPDHDTVAGELRSELEAMPPEARSLALVVSPALSQAPEVAAVVRHALTGITHAMSAIFGAVVPIAVVIDATLLQACREAQWSQQRLVESDRAQELARRIARALGVPIRGETLAVSATRLAELDTEVVAAKARRRAIEQSIRSKLPSV